MIGKLLGEYAAAQKKKKKKRYFSPSLTPHSDRLPMGKRELKARKKLLPLHLTWDNKWRE